MQRLSYPTENVILKKITWNRIVLSFKDSPRKPLGRRPSLSLHSLRPSIQEAKYSAVVLQCKRSRMAYASKCGDSCGRSLFRSVRRSRCSRTVDFNFPRKSLRHAPCAAAAAAAKAAFCFTLEFLDGTFLPCGEADRSMRGFGFLVDIKLILSICNNFAISRCVNFGVNNLKFEPWRERETRVQRD